MRCLPARRFAPQVAHVSRSGFLSVGGRTDRRTKTRRYGSTDRQSSTETASTNLTDLETQLTQAVTDENYELAAQLRDQIAAKKEEDPIVVLEAELRAAVEAEDYGLAAECRDKIADEIARRPPPPPTKSSSGTRSSATTEGVRVDVQSIFVPQHSGVQGNMFAYQITITNVAHPTTIKLISRHWEIKDAKGRERIVDGEGVVGEQPELAPGESFTYQSSCPLQTERGTMKGHFEFYSRASTSTSWNTSFLVYVAQFGLDVAAPQAFEK
jgi:ApaG protein